MNKNMNISRKLLLVSLFGFAVYGQVSAIMPSQRELFETYQEWRELRGEIEQATKQLFEAIADEDFEKAKNALEIGAPINDTNSQGDTALYLAVKLGNREIVELLLGRGANTRSVNSGGKTPRDVATDEEIIELLESAASKN